MSVQNMTIFHCQKCGRVVHQPHELPPPLCCQEPMACAVPNVTEGFSERENRFLRENDALILVEEVTELSDWCRKQDEGGASQYQELARKCEDLHCLLLEPFREPNEADVRDGPWMSKSQELAVEKQDLLSRLQQFIDNLRQREPSFMSWSEVSDRLDSLVAEIRRHAEAEDALPRGKRDETSNRLM